MRDALHERTGILLGAFSVEALRCGFMGTSIALRPVLFCWMYMTTYYLAVVGAQCKR